VTGQIVAQTLNVQQVTSSIVFSSGSNTFGCDLNSRQTFTGSVLMTGSLIVNTTGPELQVTNNGVILGNLLTDNHSITGSLRVTGSLTGTGAATFACSLNAASISISGNARFYSAGNWMQFEENVLTSLNNDGAHIRSVVSADAAPTYAWKGDTDTGMYTPGANTIAFSTAAVERLRINSCGNVGIGISPSYKLDINNGASGVVLNLEGTNAYNAETGILMSAGRAKISAFLNGTGGTPGTSLRFYTMPDEGSVTERMRITSAGNVLINGTTVQNNGTCRGNLTINGTTSILNLSISDTNAGYLYHGGTDLLLVNAKCGASLFYTNDVERVRITSDGLVRISKILQVDDAQLNTPKYITFEANISTGASAFLGDIRWYNKQWDNNIKAQIVALTDTDITNGRLSFRTGTNGVDATERMRITSTGNVGIGTNNNPQAMLDVADGSSNTLMLLKNTSTANTTGKNAMYAFYGTDTVGTQKAVGGMQAVPNDVNWVNGLLYWYVRAGDGQTLRMSLSSGGALVISGALTEGGSPSDINLKQNLVKITSPLEKISQINGYNFEWKEGSPARGCILNIVQDAGIVAQEIEKVMPEIVRTSDNNKVVNYNGLVGLLIEGMKAQQCTINTLKTCIGIA
jgi:hypothetical protein